MRAYEIYPFNFPTWLLLEEQAFIAIDTNQTYSYCTAHGHFQEEDGRQKL